MHIPDHLLTGPVCPVTAALAIAGIATASVFAVRTKDKPTAPRMAAVSALIFAAQMMNFPVQNGTSGHFLGASLAVLLLGIPHGILSLVAVLTVQCLVFSDGGLSALSANIVNMALVGSLPAAMTVLIMKKSPSPARKTLFTAGASWLSVVMAALVCSLELGLSGAVSLSAALPSMIGIHALIGIGEALLTVAALGILNWTNVRRPSGWSDGIPFFGAVVIGLILSPLASSFPDGLERVLEKLGALHRGAPVFAAPFRDYSVPLIHQPYLTSALAGLAGVLAVFAAAWVTGKLLSLKQKTAVTSAK